MRTDSGYSRGSGMNGHGAVAEAVTMERRFTLLEVGQADHSRRITALEDGRHILSPPPPAAPSGLTGSRPWLALLSQAAGSAGQWMGGILAMAYVLKGGDALTALQALVKLF
jgi:hypothetical protein